MKRAEILSPPVRFLSFDSAPASSLLGFDGRHEARTAQPGHVGRMPVGARFHEGVHGRVGRVVAKNRGCGYYEHRLAVRARSVQEEQGVLCVDPVSA